MHRILKRIATVYLKVGLPMSVLFYLASIPDDLYIDATPIDCLLLGIGATLLSVLFEAIQKRYLDTSKK